MRGGGARYVAKASNAEGPSVEQAASASYTCLCSGCCLCTKYCHSNPSSLGLQSLSLALGQDEVLLLVRSRGKSVHTRASERVRALQLAEKAYQALINPLLPLPIRLRRDPIPLGDEPGMRHARKVGDDAVYFACCRRGGGGRGRGECQPGAGEGSGSGREATNVQSLTRYSIKSSRFGVQGSTFIPSSCANLTCAGVVKGMNPAIPTSVTLEA